MICNSYAIICEYNPFHYGHLHQIDTLRQNGAEFIICIMSGNFTQRGDAAIMPKYERALSAIACGADLVLELPFPFSCAYAEAFAAAGVRIAEQAGAQFLSFGSECADIKALSEVADVSLSDDFLHKLSKGDQSYGNTAYIKLLEESCGVTLASNDILGFQYIREIKKQGLRLTPTCIKRTGAEYNSESLCSTDGQPSSAAAIRRAISEGKDISEYVPDAVMTIFNRMKKQSCAPTDKALLERAVLLHFRVTPPEHHADVADMPTGFAERMYRAACGSTSLDQMTDTLRNTSFSEARIKRLMLFCICGVKRSDMQADSVKYAHLLAANENGRRYLAMLRKGGNDFIVTKIADIKKLGDTDSRQAELEKRADSLYTLLMPCAKESDYFIKTSPYIRCNGK